jgi:hypothetical protein
MIAVNTACGEVYTGNTVEFQHLTGVKTGVVKDITSTINDITLSIYCHDKTGGYTLSVPHYNILQVINKPLLQEEIKKPARYNKKGKMECWDVILDQEMNFLEGSVLKYLWRYKEKNGIHDLEKAKIYIDKIIEGLKK